jgi:hypothetical protein
MIERGEYLIGEPNVPKTAREFWAYVDRRSGDEDLGAASFLEQAHRKHFYFGIADGVKAEVRAVPPVRRAPQCAGRPQNGVGL